MATTPTTMIIRALQMIGEKPIGGTLSSGEQTSYLSVLNAMMDSWGLERLMVYQLLQESKALTAGVGSYTIGSGGTFNTTRPNKIVDPCFIRDADSFDSPLMIIDAEQYGSLPVKSTGNTYPEYLFYDSAFVGSLGTIYLYPLPDAGLTLYINSWKQLQSFATISDTVTLPPGYQRAIESNLAIELAPGFTSVSPEVMKIARDSKAAVKRVNSVVGVLKMPFTGNNPRSTVLTG